MRVMRTASLIALVVAGCMVASATAQGAPTDNRLVDASKRVAGFTAGELLGEEWRQLLELPLTANPFAGTGDNCMSAGHKDKVLILWTTGPPAPAAVCDVKPGTPVFFYAVGGECSSVEPAPWFGETAEEQRQCTRKSLLETDVGAIWVSIDGGPAVNIGVERFITFSEQRRVVLPDPNILGVRGNRSATFVASAYAAMIRPLPPGSHTITVTFVGGQFGGSTSRAVVNVVPGLKR